MPPRNEARYRLFMYLQTAHHTLVLFGDPQGRNGGNCELEKGGDCM